MSGCSNDRCWISVPCCRLLNRGVACLSTADHMYSGAPARHCIRRACTDKRHGGVDGLTLRGLLEVRSSKKCLNLRISGLAPALLDQLIEHPNCGKKVFPTCEAGHMGRQQRRHSLSWCLVTSILVSSLAKRTSSSNVGGHQQGRQRGPVVEGIEHHALDDVVQTTFAPSSRIMSLHSEQGTLLRR